MPSKFKANRKWQLWWQNKQRKTPKLLTKRSQGPNHKRRDPCQTRRHNKSFSQCSNLFSRCKAKAATVYRSSSWRLVRRKRRSRKSARLWHPQCVNWGQCPRLQSLAQKRAGPLEKKCRQMTSFLRVKAYLASIAWTLKAEKPSRGTFQMRIPRRDVWPRSSNKREELSSLLRRWFCTLFTAGLCYLTLSRVWEGDHFGPVCATAKLV